MLRLGLGLGDLCCRVRVSSVGLGLGLGILWCRVSKHCGVGLGILWYRVRVRHFVV